MNDIIPNSICRGIGEKSLEERLAPYIDTASQWFESYISPIGICQEIPGADQSAETSIIHLYALWLAAPALDVTLHPNGLAVVSTDSLAPASPERSMQFRLSIMRLLMERVERIVPQLALSDRWRQSDPAGNYWLATVQQSALAACQLAGLPYDFDSFLKAVELIAAEEDAIAERAISAPILELLRTEKFSPSSPAIRDIRRCVSAAVRACLSDMTQAEKRQLLQRHLDRFVNIVLASRYLTDIFCSSPVGMLYMETPRFDNSKDSTAYFF